MPIKSPATGGYFLFFISQCFFCAIPMVLDYFHCIVNVILLLYFSMLCKVLKGYFSFSVHMRDPNNQLHVIKNLKITVNNIVTQAPLQAGIRKLLNDVVSSSQPAESLVPNVITAGDYDLNISGKH